jgi:hypothetical protein
MIMGRWQAVKTVVNFRVPCNGSLDKLRNAQRLKKGTLSLHFVNAELQNVTEHSATLQS